MVQLSKEQARHRPQPRLQHPQPLPRKKHRVFGFSRACVGPCAASRAPRRQPRAHALAAVPQRERRLPRFVRAPRDDQYILLPRGSESPPRALGVSPQSAPHIIGVERHRCSRRRRPRCCRDRQPSGEGILQRAAIDAL